jgi:2-polyprenyl-6-methoxyphenol hydroxylase-like FAD-dependent oxidoreductase
MNKKKLNKHAIVVGGSLAGMLAARVLADYFNRVTIIERDPLSEIPEPRKGVPQARHLHVLLARGREVLQQLFPGLVEELIALGAPLVDMAADLAWLTPAGWGARFDSEIRIIGSSRDLLECSIRQRLASFTNVRFISECDVKELIIDPNNDRIAGVKLSCRNAASSFACEQTLEGDLVADASGRSSRAPQWLKEKGYDPPSETIVNAFLGYASRIYRRNDSLRDCKGVYVQPAPPGDNRGGALFPVEGNRLILTLAGYGKDYPPPDEEGFIEFARSLRTPSIYNVIKDAEPLSPIFTYRATENRLRHYEKTRRLPEGLIILGDAVCAFNPVFAQGMTMAAIGAMTLDQCLRDRYKKSPDGDLMGLSRRFQKKLAKVNVAPWMLATSEDLRVSGCVGEPHGFIAGLMQRYADKVVRLSTDSPKARKALLEVFNLLKPPSALFNPVIPFQIVARSLSRYERSEQAI